MTPQQMFDSMVWAKSYLDKLRVADPNAHIAGGYIRDLDNGRALKDIDVFLSAPPLHVMTAMEGMELLDIIEEHYFDHDPGVILESRTYQHHDCEGLPINVIRLRDSLTMEQNIDRFDFGICRAAWDGANVIKTDEYYADKAAKAFVLRRCENRLQYDRSVRARYPRLAKKYEGWPLVIPPEFEQFSKAPLDVFDDLTEL